MSKIDVTTQVAKLEETLRSSTDPVRRSEALAILQRWQFDDMLDDGSQRRAKALVDEFDPNRRLRRARNSE